jgi:hypothetical protein
MEGCQYIGPEQTQFPYSVCGNKHTWPGKSYCEQHVWTVYKKHSASGTVRKNKIIEREMAHVRHLESIDPE